MALFGVGFVPIKIGLASLVTVGAVVGLYTIHMQLLCRHVRRVQRQRWLALNDSRLTCAADAEVAPDPDRPSVPVLALSSAQLLWLRDVGPRRSTERQQHSLAHGADG